MLSGVELNVLHISESDAAGGAGRAAYKLHRGLNGLGNLSRMLVGRKVTRDADIRPLKRNLVWRALDRASGQLLDLLSLQYVFYPSSFGVLADEWFRSADVVQLHNLHGAYSLDCERWRHGCGACPYLGEYPRLRGDTTALLWKLKNAVYDHSKLTLVVPSQWMSDLVAASPLLSRFNVRYIPTGIDLEVFRPGPQDEARCRLLLPLDRRIVFFAAANINERRKGLHLLAEALRRLEDPPLLLVAGSGTVARGIETRYLGTVMDEEVLADAYRAADVFAVPTLADVLTQTAPESIACGTPCIAFDRGGVTDVVRHMQTGYSARFGAIDSLAEGLRTLLGDAELLDRLGRRCREVAEQEFSVDVQVQRYAGLYEELVAAA